MKGEEAMSSENEMWPVRATAWELAAFSFRHPTHELARAITSGEWFDAACEIGDALGVILPEDFGKGLPSPSFVYLLVLVSWMCSRLMTSRLK